jgi:hypothetical protein
MKDWELRREKLNESNAWKADLTAKADWKG